MNWSSARPSRCTPTNATVSPPRKRWTSSTQFGAGLRTSRVESCRPPMTASEASAHATIPPARAVYHHVCERTDGAYGCRALSCRVSSCARRRAPSSPRSSRSSRRGRRASTAVAGVAARGARSCPTRRGGGRRGVEVRGRDRPADAEERRDAQPAEQPPGGRRRVRPARVRRDGAAFLAAPAVGAPPAGVAAAAADRAVGPDAARRSWSRRIRSAGSTSLVSGQSSEVSLLAGSAFVAVAAGAESRPSCSPPSCATVRTDATGAVAAAPGVAATVVATGGAGARRRPESECADAGADGDRRGQRGSSRSRSRRRLRSSAPSCAPLVRRCRPPSRSVRARCGQPTRGREGPSAASVKCP